MGEAGKVILTCPMQVELKLTKSEWGRVNKMVKTRKDDRNKGATRGVKRGNGNELVPLEWLQTKD